MNQSIHLATSTGTASAPLYATFEHEIEGSVFTFGIHANVSGHRSLKLSEFSTGMGVADLPEDAEALPDATALVDHGREALQSVIHLHGVVAVANILTTNRSSRVALNS